MRTWSKRADAAQRYQVELHYALEAQRQIHRADLYRALAPAALSEPLVLNEWIRICTYRFSQQPLNAYGSTIGVGGRFNFGDALDSADSLAFPALYIGETKSVAYREYFGMDESESTVLSAQEFALTPNKAYSVIPINGLMHNVLDVTRTTKLREFVEILSSFTVSKETQALATRAGFTPRMLVSSAELFNDVLTEKHFRGWGRNHGLPASCQIFGKLVWEAQYDGVLYRSVKGGGKCLAVFPQNLEYSDSKLWLADAAPAHAITALDDSNWQLACNP